MNWSVNRRAAASIARHASSHAEARELLAMVGVVDSEGRLLPDDNRTYELGDPGPSQAKDADPVGPRAFAEHGRRPVGMTTPLGLATLQPIEQQPKPKPKKERQSRPSKPRQIAVCGTYGGYSKHRRLKEEACDSCKTAAQEYRQKYMSKYRADGRERVARKKAVCGTTGGWSRHKRLGEKSCRACLDAKNAYWRVKKAANRLAAGKPPSQPRELNALCGTRSGYEKHRRLHTAICGPCREANSKRSEMDRAMKGAA